jgi:hypothetical protein
MKYFMENLSIVFNIIQLMIIVGMLNGMWSDILKKQTDIEEQLLVWLDDAEIQRRELKAKIANLELHLIKSDPTYVRYPDQ